MIVPRLHVSSGYGGCQQLTAIAAKLPTDDPFFRPSEWHIALVRNSVLHVVYPPSSHRDVQISLRQKAERITGNQVVFRRHVVRQYGRTDDPQLVNTDCLWNMATGGWEPYLPIHSRGKKRALVELDTTGASSDELKSGLLQAAHIVPQCFGKKLFRRIFGDTHHHSDLWAPGNGLLLPRGVAAAMDDWSISIVPDIPDHDPPQACVQQWMSSYPTQDFKFRVIDPTDENLGRRITLAKGDYRTGRDLDGVKVSFIKPFRPNLMYLYFNHCCTIVKKNRGLFRDDTTDEWVIRFWRAEQERMKLEGRAGEIQHRPFTREYDLKAFWRGMLDDLARMDRDPKGAVVDWSMELRYLEKVEEPSKTTVAANEANPDINTITSVADEAIRNIT
ncbi:hypothetical protein F4775DRAFT_243588 [Biscogniauxia sp. FL1348]|nr:hypothetical protein F4775DRAFT_243588 [Biscogniauxia sp. FL1348]